MAVPDGRLDGSDDDEGGLFEEERVELGEEDDIYHSETPIHLRPLVSAAESGDVNTLRIALGKRYLSCACAHTLQTRYVPF